MSRNSQEYAEMYNRSGSFERILYWFMNNANKLWLAYYEKNSNEEKLEYEEWLKKIYGLNITNIANYYNILKEDDNKRNIIEDTESKIISGEILLDEIIKIVETERKEVITNRKHSMNGAKGAAITNEIKRAKAKEKQEEKNGEEIG